MNRLAYCLLLAALGGCEQPTGSGGDEAQPSGSALSPANGDGASVAADELSILGVRLGDTRAVAIQRLGACPLEDRCLYPERGVELGLSHGRVERLVLHAAGEREVIIPGGNTVFQGYAGEVAGLRLLSPAQEVLRALGEPAAKLRPLRAPEQPATERELWEYPARGFALELEPSERGLRVVRVHIPLAPARPLPPEPARTPAP